MKLKDPEALLQTQANTPQQVNIDFGGMHFYGDIADSKFLEKAAEYTADKISEAVNLRRGTKCLSKP